MEAVVFDLDGVIVDTEKYWHQAEKEMYMEITGQKVDPSEFSGMTISNTYEKLDERYDVEASFDDFFQMYDDRAREVYMEKAELMPDFKSLLQELRDRGLKIGVATGSYWTDYVIDRFGLEFDAKSDSNLTEGNGKPDPETYELAIEKLDVAADKAVAVEDTDAGIESAKAAGLYCIAYEGSDGQSLSEADEVVSSPEGLRARLLELTG